MKNLFGNCSFLNCGLMSFAQRDLSVTGFDHFTIKFQLSLSLVWASYPLLFRALWRIHAWLAIRISIRIAHLAVLVILPKLWSLLVIPFLNMPGIAHSRRAHLIMPLHLLLLIEDHPHIFSWKALRSFPIISRVVDAIVCRSIIILILW